MADTTEVTEPAEDATDPGDDDEDLFCADDDAPSAEDTTAVDAKPEAHTESATVDSDKAVKTEAVETAPSPSSKIPRKNGDSSSNSGSTKTEAAANSGPAATEGPVKTEPGKTDALSSPIPAKSERVVNTSAAKSEASGSAPAKKSEKAKLFASQFGLPDGVKIPASVTGALLQGRLLDTLRNLPTQLINDALAEYDDAVQIKGEAIRNHGAYLYGVIKRYVNVQERASRGEGQGILPMGPDLTPAVQTRLRNLVEQKFCTQEEMNDKVKSKIRMLSEKDALFAIDELASVERRQIRNFGSYFMGILNRYMRSETGSGNHFGRGNKDGGKHHQGDGRQPHSRFDDRRGSGGDDRFHGRGPNADRRGRDRQFRDQKESYRRERSRDRYEEDRRRGAFDNRDASDRDRSRYDPRQQPPPPQQQQMHYPGPQQNPPFMGRQPQMGVSGNPPPPPPRSAVGPGGMQVVNAYAPQQAMQQAPPAQSQIVYGAPPTAMDQPQFVPQMASHPPSSSPMVQPAPGAPGGPRFPQPVSVMGGQPPQPLHVMGGHPQQHYGAPVVMNNSTPPGVTDPQSARARQQPPPPSNSYAHGMQNLNQVVPPPVAGQPNPPMVGLPQQAPMPGSLPAPGAPPGAGRWQQPAQPQGQAPVDIMGLADKAASVVQALANQNKLQIPSERGRMPPPIQGSYQPPGAAPNAPAPYGAVAPPSIAAPHAPGFVPPQPPHNPPMEGHRGGGASGGAAVRRRTTAAMSELPVMVQYAVKNLQATGQIDGQLDDGMLGMVKDLPEQLALQALQKFSTIDKNTMRNKTAYLAGVLRRELEKINRR